MKVALIGIKIPDNYQFLSTEDWFKYYSKNTGNVAFHYAIKHQINTQNNYINELFWSDAHLEKNQNYDIGIIPLANQLGKHANFGKLAESWKNIKYPLVAIGLGAQSGDLSLRKLDIEIPDGTLEWVKLLQEKSPTDYYPNLALRGEYTYHILEKYNLAKKTVILGCPSLFLNPKKNLGHKIMEKFEDNLNNNTNRIGVAAGDRRWKYLQKIEEYLVKLAIKTKGRYFFQSPEESIYLGRYEIDKLTETQLKAWNEYITPYFEPSKFLEWIRANGVVYLSVPEWMEDIKHHDFIVGARFHGVMLAIQSGIPGLCIAHDSRIVELCETTKVPYIKYTEIKNELTEKDLFEIFERQFNPKEFDTNRLKLANRYKEFLENNRIKFVNF